MPINCSFDAGSGLFLADFRGIVSVDDVATAMNHSFVVSKDWASQITVCDMQNIGKLNLTVQDLGVMAGKLAVIVGGLDRPYRKILIASDDHSFGLSRLYSTHAALSGMSDKIAVVRSTADAAAWLELTPAELNQTLSALPGQVDTPAG